MKRIINGVSLVLFSLCILIYTHTSAAAFSVKYYSSLEACFEENPGLFEEIKQACSELGEDCEISCQENTLTVRWVIDMGGETIDDSEIIDLINSGELVSPADVKEMTEYIKELESDIGTDGIEFRFILCESVQRAEILSMIINHNGVEIGSEIGSGNGGQTGSSDDDSSDEKYSATEIYYMTVPKVVDIVVYDADGVLYASGSGFFINASGTIVTNFHVMEGAASAKVITYDEETYDVNSVFGYDSTLDLAIISISKYGNDYLKISDREPKTGETIYTLGSSLGLSGTFSDGLISTASRMINGADCIQISAPISHGNSGLLFTGRRICRPHSPECSLGSAAFDFRVVGPNCEAGLTN